MTGRIARSIAAFGAAAFVVLGGSGVSAKDTTVAIKDNYFAPPYVLVTVGDEVRWINSGSVQHTVVSYPDSPRSFDSSPGTESGNCTPPPLLGRADCLEPGSEFSQVFRKAGTYEYYCKVAGHADVSVEPDPEIRSGREQPCGMCGIVVVNKKSSPGPLVRQTESATPRATLSPSATPSETTTLAPSPGESDPSVAGGGLPVAGDGAQLGIALVAIVALGGLGFLVWQRFLAPR